MPTVRRQYRGRALMIENRNYRSCGACGTCYKKPCACIKRQCRVTLRQVLLNLLNEQVQITTPFGVMTGTLLAVKRDYIVLIDAAGDQILIPLKKIELVSEL